MSRNAGRRGPCGGSLELVRSWGPCRALHRWSVSERPSNGRPPDSRGANLKTPRVERLRTGRLAALSASTCLDVARRQGPWVKALGLRTLRRLVCARTLGVPRALALLNSGRRHWNSGRTMAPHVAKNRTGRAKSASRAGRGRVDAGPTRRLRRDPPRERGGIRG